MNGQSKETIEEVERILAEDPASDDLLEICERLAPIGLLPELIRTCTPNQPHPHLARCVAYVVSQIADTQPTSALVLASDLHGMASARHDQTVQINLLTAILRASTNLEAGPLHQPGIINILLDALKSTEPVRLTLVGTLEALSDQKNLSASEWSQLQTFHGSSVRDEASGDLAELLKVDHA